jgi:hypothetical protein
MQFNLIVALRLLAAAFLWSVSASANASCEDAYKDALRDRQFSEYDWSSLNTVYDNQCTQTGEKNSSSSSVGLNAIVQAIPIGFTGNTADSSEKMTNFCHNYHSLRFDKSHHAATSDTVVVEALRSLNACVLIESKSGVAVTHKFADPDSLAINFEFNNSTTKFLVQGVATKNITCRANGHAAGALGQTTSFEANSNFSILCVREGEREADGTTVYRPASIAIGTNFDSYTVSVPGDSIYDHDLASEASDTIKGLTSSLNDTIQTLSTTSKERQTLSDFKNRVDGLKITVHSVVIGSAHPGFGGQWFGCGSSPESIRDQLCKGANKSSVDPIQTATPGGGCGYVRFAVTCVTY